MITDSWRVGTAYGGTHRWFWVRIHADVRDLRAACHRTRPHLGRRYWDDAAAVCHSATARYRDTDVEMAEPHWPANGYAGTIRFAADRMTPEIIAHELVHAACQVYRMNHALRVDLGDGFDLDSLGREENFAYIYGGLSREMDAQLVSRAG